jgi:hypothetical protein
MLRIFCRRQRAGRTRKKIQVVHVVTRTGDDRMIAATDEDRITVPDFQGLLAGILAGIEMLEGETFPLTDPVIVDLIQIGLRGRIVYVVLVRRITRPVAARRVDLNCHQLIRRKIGRDDIDDLARHISATTQAAADVTGSDEPRLKPSFGRNSTFRKFTGRLGRKRSLVPGRQVECIREAVKNIPSLSNAVSTVSPIEQTGSTQEYKCGLLVIGARSKDVARLQTADKETHPIPVGLLAREIEEFARFLRGQLQGMEEKTIFAQVSSLRLRSVDGTLQTKVVV